MSGTQTGILKPLTGPFVLQPLKSSPVRTLGIVLIMHNHGEMVINFAYRLLAALKELPPSKIEVIFAACDSDDNSFTKARYLVQRHQSAYLMRVPRGNNGAEVLFRAWQRSRASILGNIEIGDEAALTAMPAMLAEAKRAINSETIDVVAGYHQLSAQWRALPHRSTIRAITAQLCGRVIMPDLFLSSKHPLSTCLFVRRNALEGQQMMLHGDIMLPNLIAHIPDIKIAEIPYANQEKIGEMGQAESQTSLRALLSTLFRLNIFHKTHVLVNKGAR